MITTPQLYLLLVQLMLISQLLRNRHGGRPEDDDLVGVARVCNRSHKPFVVIVKANLPATSMQDM